MPKIIKDIQEWYYPLSINGNTKANILFKNIKCSRKLQNILKGHYKINISNDIFITQLHVACQLKQKTRRCIICFS